MSDEKGAAQPTQQMVTRSGEVVDVPVSKVASLYRSGTAGFIEGAPVFVKKGRDIVEMSADDAGTYLDSKASMYASVATGQQFARQEGERRFGTLGSEAAAVGLGAARGLSFGGSDLLISELGGDGAREYLAGQQEYNPNLSLLGEVGGGIAGALATSGAGAAGGVSVLGRAGRALLAPTRAVGLLGEGAGALAARTAVGAGLREGGLAARMLQGGVHAAVEGAAYGAGNAVSESAIQGDPLTVEKLVAGAGHGALLGAALGAGMGAAGAGADRLAERGASAAKRGKEAVDSFLSKRFPEGASPTENLLSDKTADIYIRSVAQGDEAMATRLKDAWRDRARLIGKGDDILEDAQRSLRKDVDDLLAAERPFTDEAKGRLKRERVEETVQKGNEGATLDHAQQRLAELREQVREMRADKQLYGHQANLKQLGELVDYTESAIAKNIGEAGQNAATFVELDFLKRKMGRLALPGRVASDTADASTSRIRQMYDSLRTDLEDTSLWGKAAEDQRAINAAWSKQIDTGSRFRQRFATVVGRDEADAFATRFASDPQKLASYVNGFGRAANDLNHEVLTSHVKNTKDLIETIHKHYGLDSKTGELEKALGAVAGFEKTIASVEGDVAKTNALKRLQEEEAAHAFGGVVGDAALRPVTTLARMAELEQLANKATQRMRASVRGLIDASMAPGGRLERIKERASTMARRGASVARTAVVSSAEAIDRREGRDERRAQRDAEREDTRRAYEELRATVVEAAARPQDVQRNIATRMAGASPAVVKGVQAKALAAQGFLSTKLPQPLRTANTLTPQLEKPVVTKQERQRFMRYAQAVNDPISVLDDMRSGRVTSEGLEVLREVYPALHQEVVAQVTEHLAEAKEKPSHAQLVRLSLLLDVPTTRMLEPAAMASYQGIISTPAQGNAPPTPPAPPRPITRIAGGYETHADALEKDDSA